MDSFFDNFVPDGFYIGKTAEDIEIYREECLSRLKFVFGKVDFPFNTKQDHIDRRSEFISGIPGSKFSTSGSSGSPFEFNIYQNDARGASYSEKKIFDIYGVDKNAFLLYVVPHRTLEYDYYYPRDVYGIKSVVMRDTYVDIFVKENKKLMDEKSVVLMAGNSILKKIMDKKIYINPYLCISVLERCLDADLLSSFFNCRVLDRIRCLDGSLSVWQCPYGVYHVDFEFCDIKSDDQKRLILTDYTNCSEAFINYHNGDYGVVSDSNNCSCGTLGKTLIDFLGRETESIYLDGKIIYGMEIYNTLFPNLAFSDSVLVQKSNGEIIFYIYGGCEEDESEARKRLSFLFGNKYKVVRCGEEVFNKYTSKNKKKRIFRES